MNSAARAGAIGRGKIAEDSVTDRIAFRNHRDRFGDGERARLRNAHIAGEIGDAFIGKSGSTQKPNGRHNQCREPTHVWNETFGAARSASLSIWKNGAGLNEPTLATRFEGNCSILTLYSRTVPL